LVENHDVAQINISGNVNIGTTTADPAYLLQVKGKVRAQEIKVEIANWPDDVFYKDYALMPLPELSVYLARNNHLPGVSSAAEVVEEGGIKLGEMNAVLLKKWKS
jgi:hypothetical protein